MQMTYTISFRRSYLESRARLLMELSNFLTTTIATVRSIANQQLLYILAVVARLRRETSQFHASPLSSKVGEHNTKIFFSVF